MKSAEDIIKGCEHDGSYIPVNEVLRLIKLAQEDAIRETIASINYSKIVENKEVELIKNNLINSL